MRGLIATMFGVFVGSLIGGWTLGDTPGQTLAAAIMNVGVFGFGALYGHRVWCGEASND